VAEEYARIDGHLALLGLVLYAGGAFLLTGVLLLAYRRLCRAQAVVEAQTTRLLQANHELALAAKATALGSVTAHLVHGLSGPLAHLQSYIARRAATATDADMEAVAPSVRHMQELVQDVVRVLGEERGGERYQITLAELADALRGKLRAMVRERDVHLRVQQEVEGNLANRHANLVLLILENLIHNSLKVTPRGGTISVRIVPHEGGVCCEVADRGPGIAPHILPGLFAPCRSTQGGSGLGLAISRQLAHQLGGRLELKAHSAQGCVFALTLPGAILAGADSVSTPVPMPAHRATGDAA
jgi:signal transduction histidine kinase